MNPIVGVFQVGKFKINLSYPLAYDSETMKCFKNYQKIARHLPFYVTLYSINDEVKLPGGSVV